MGAFLRMKVILNVLCEGGGGTFVGAINRHSCVYKDRTRSRHRARQSWLCREEELTIETQSIVSPRSVRQIERSRQRQGWNPSIQLCREGWKPKRLFLLLCARVLVSCVERSESECGTDDGE